MTLSIRPATDREWPEAGRITLAAYRAAGFIDDDSEYAHELADTAGRAATTHLLVAIDDGALVGTATLITDLTSPYAEIAQPGEAELRMLAVDPAHQSAGIGRALVEECLRGSAAAGCTRLVLSSRPEMTTAHRLYQRLGFTRSPERDWEPVPGFLLITYVGPASALGN